MLFLHNFIYQNLEYNVGVSSASFPADNYEDLAGVLYGIKPDKTELLDNLVTKQIF